MVLTTPPRLHIRRPSPTTAEFTVTTLPCSRAPLRILLLLRLLLALAVILLLHALWTTTTMAMAATATCSLSLSAAAASSTGPCLAHTHTHTHTHTGTGGAAFLDSPLQTAQSALERYQRSPVGEVLRRIATSLPPVVLVALCLGACYALTRRVHCTESLLVLRGLGVQTSESPSWGMSLGWGAGGATTRFIPTEKIRDIFVNEAFRGMEVRYYLVVVVEGEGELVVVFPGLLPRRDIVEEVWRGARECLYEKRDGE
ncbi:hypothetical protein E4U17_005373 [Claviceps sp. LM77 group G4]|nr:hypothetical protein E4U17_005373 [Claviceps sp. LM77 group G4]KAG6072687.1 hypothetical protein E4U33_003179 [Claviceps sp. LM78 group G4]KAG6082925.1 hypothetical protein E4U16_005231 [Claviceps sp. LM84 group G4]